MALPPKRDKNKKNTIEMMQGQKGCTRQRVMGSRYARSEDIGQWRLQQVQKEKEIQQQFTQLFEGLMQMIYNKSMQMRSKNRVSMKTQ